MVKYKCKTINIYIDTTYHMNCQSSFVAVDMALIKLIQMNYNVRENYSWWMRCV